jgi:hypothetical protein
MSVSERRRLEVFSCGGVMGVPTHPDPQEVAHPCCLMRRVSGTMLTEPALDLVEESC